MPAFTTFQKVLMGFTAIGGSSLYYLQNNEKNHVKTSWTTNYTPSVKWDDNWDHRSLQSQVHPRQILTPKDENQLNETMEKKKSSACRHLLLIRHGQYNLNGATDDDRILTKLGREQAQWTGKRLKELGLPYTDMVKSTMTRAQETGYIISNELPDVPVKNCHMLREGAPIPPEPPIGSWKPETYQFYQDGARIEAAFRNYFHRADASQTKDSYTLLVCHGNVIRYFVCRALQFPPEAWLRMSVNHASITWITVTPSGRVILRTLGDSGHMPASVVTSH